uniref:G-protein coupled receptors family 2 profile 1 domain-containing protein n=1 Tax=Chrysemys picta bellii TaxID=8478 RepID=A0A8C3IJN5_CHRPI
MGISTYSGLCSNMWFYSRTSLGSVSIVMTVFVVKQVLGSLLAKTTTKWLNYKNDCLKTLQESAVETGIYCKGTFDQLVCWPYSLPGNVSVPCPSYLPWLENGNVISLFLKDSYQESSLQEGVVSAGSTVLELPGGLLGPILHHLLPG